MKAAADATAVVSASLEAVAVLEAPPAAQAVAVTVTEAVDRLDWMAEALADATAWAQGQEADAKLLAADEATALATAVAARQTQSRQAKAGHVRLQAASYEDRSTCAAGWHFSSHG